MSENKIIIDTQLGIEFSDSVFVNEVLTLNHLKTGMIGLYNSVRPAEIEIQSSRPGKRVFFSGYGLMPEGFEQMLPCYFHWFANSVCNYARLAGYIVSREQNHISDSDLDMEPNRKKIKAACTEYINSLPEIQSVLKWRNKVSAHFALTDPRNDDNIATLMASVISCISFDNDRYQTGLMTYSFGNDSQSHDSEIPKWSLTETFEKLKDRFWPDVTFNS